MNKLMPLLLLIFTTVFISCGKKVEDSDNQKEEENTVISANTSKDARTKSVLYSAIESNDTLLVRSALTELVDLNFIFSDGETPLTKAIKSSKSEIILEIFKSSNIINKENIFFEIPVNLVISSPRLNSSKKRDIIKLFLRKKLNVNKKGVHGITPIETAINNKEEAIGMLLVKSGSNLSEAFTGADLIETSRSYRLERLNKFLIEVSEVVRPDLETIRLSIKANKRNLLEYLIKKKSNASQLINKHNLLLEALKINDVGSRLNILSYLLKVKGVSPDGSDNHLTPLIYAATQFSSSHKRSLAFLLRAGANIYHKDNHGNSALDHAAINLNTENVVLLHSRILHTSRDNFNSPGSQANVEILSACNKTPSKRTARRIVRNGKQKRSNILSELRCPFN